MANYINPISEPNPFLVTPPVVYVVRHVRITPGGEVVVEDANSLPRQIMRIDAHRMFPAAKVSAPKERNLPECGQRKKFYV